MYWNLIHPKATIEHLGWLPMMFSEASDLSAREQAEKNYGPIGGGWRPVEGWKMTNRGLAYPGDPPMPLVAEAQLRDEVIRLYAMSWVAIVQPDGTFEVARMD